MKESNLDHYFQRFPSYKEACEIIKKVEEEGFETWLAGGCVRDALLCLKINDFDLATSAPPAQIIEIFGEENCLAHGAEFGSVAVKLKGFVFEITTFRSDVGVEDNRHPKKIKFSNKEEDVLRRDFTINGLLYHPDRGIFDHVDGVRDIRNGVLKAIGEPDLRFKEDTLRVLRLYRFSLNLGFEIEEQTLNASKSHIDLLNNISKERIFDESVKTLSKEIDQEKFEKLFNFFFNKPFKSFDLNQEISNKTDELAFKFSYLDDLFHKIVEVKEYILKKTLKKRFLLFKTMHQFIKRDDLDSAVQAYIKNEEVKYESLTNFQDVWNLFLKYYPSNSKIKKIHEHLFSLNENDFKKILALKAKVIAARKEKGPKLGEELVKLYKKEIFNT